jgi:methyl-accepting chemotaxis protein
LKNQDLKTYASLARIGFPRSYSGKIMLVLFAGTHLPLVALVLYLLLVSPGGLGTHLGVLAALLIATLLGFVATLFALRALLAPVRLASSSLEAYLDDRRKPELPTGFSDEAGELMADVQHAIEHLDTTIRSLEGLSGTDHLTGLPNRRKGEERLAEDLARAKRGRAILTVAVVNTAQRQGGRLAIPLGRGRVRAGAVGRFCFRLARSRAGAHQRGPQAEPCSPARG